MDKNIEKDLLIKTIKTLTLERNMLKDLFYGINKSTTPMWLDDEFPKIFQLCKTKEEADELYKVLTSIVHPDKGNDERRFLEMKNSYDEFVSRFNSNL